jgi:hypothetical protein
MSAGEQGGGERAWPPFAPGGLQAIYEENGRVAATFWEWRHKTTTQCFLVLGGLTAIASWAFERDLRGFVLVPFAVGAIFAFCCFVLNRRTRQILEWCYAVGGEIEIRWRPRSPVRAGPVTDAATGEGTEDRADDAATEKRLRRAKKTLIALLKRGPLARFIDGRRLTPDEKANRASAGQSGGPYRHLATNPARTLLGREADPDLKWGPKAPATYARTLGGMYLALSLVMLLAGIALEFYVDPPKDDPGVTIEYRLDVRPPSP